MKRFAGTALLVFVVAVGAYAFADDQPQPKATVHKDSAAIAKRDNGDNPPPSGTPEDKQRAVLRESIEYLQKLRKVANRPRGDRLRTLL